MMIMNWVGFLSFVGDDLALRGIFSVMITNWVGFLSFVGFGSRGL